MDVITLMLAGLAVLAGLALVLTLADRALESRWREVAARRREAWERRQR